MASAQQAVDENRGRHHERTRSGFRAFLHSRSPSKGATLPPKLTTEFEGLPKFEHSPEDFSLPAYEFPHSRALGEIPQNGQKTPSAVSPRKSKNESRKDSGDGSKTLHKKTMSSVSLKSLFRDSDDKPKKEKEEKRKDSPKKSKSSTNLAALLSPKKSSKSLKKAAAEAEAKDKENRLPAVNGLESPIRPPIYAQFSTDRFISTPQGGRFVEDSLDYFGPSVASPTDDFKLFSEEIPSLINSANGSRPNSLMIPREYIVQDISRPTTPPKYLDHVRSPVSSNKPSFEYKRSFDQKPSFERTSLHKTSFDHKPSFDRSSAHKPSFERTNSGRSTDRPVLSRIYTMPESRVPVVEPVKSPAKRSKSPEKGPTLSQRSSRLLNAMSSTFNTSPPKPAPVLKDPYDGPEFKKKPRPVSHIQDINAEFEAMLDRRNIPEGQRANLRAVEEHVKVDLVRHDLEEIALARTKLENKASLESVSTARSTATTAPEEEPEKPKKQRSRTFKGLSFSKSSMKTSDLADLSGFTKGHGRSKSAESTIDKRSISSASSTVGSIIAKINNQTPEDYVAYLRKPQKVEDMEVGKIHKLRLLLRNETVAWTDSFVELGGQAEIISLLHRIMGLEWREEHEDQLLHETLLCLKALCTTANAMKRLDEVHTTLFPALLHLIFDKEKKGPSEFSTRNIIFSVLFAYLQSAPIPQRQKRAEILLGYLRDPVPDEDKRAPGFVLQMHQERPYRVWTKEVSDVTKEVFWIFLHTLNVIAPPTESEKADWALTASDENGFMKRHFPIPTPPVPTAPYVGSVEWEATTYITSHLLLLNGIIASLPQDARLKLRQEMRISKFERVMGDSFRTCKEKLYPGVHTALRDWVSAAVEDGWDYKVVNQGAKTEEEEKRARSPFKRSPVKKREGEVEFLKIDLPKLDRGDEDDGGWL